MLGIAIEPLDPSSCYHLFPRHESMNIKRLLLFFFRLARGRASANQPKDTAPLIASAKYHLIPPNSGNGERDERSGIVRRDATGHDRRLSPGGGRSQAERGRHDLWGGGHPDHRFA